MSPPPRAAKSASSDSSFPNPKSLIPSPHFMPRHVTLFTGQWADLPLEQLAPLAKKMGYDGLELETEPGDLFAFDNSRPHWVINPTDFERWTLIICLRLEQPNCLNCTWRDPQVPPKE